MVKPELLVMGGDDTGYHDFKVLGPVLRSFLEAAGFSVTLSEDLNMFLSKNLKAFAAVRWVLDTVS
jgi:hypothetical protein